MKQHSALPSVQLGLRANLAQFVLLVVVNACLGSFLKNPAQ